MLSLPMSYRRSSSVSTLAVITLAIAVAMAPSSAMAQGPQIISTAAGTGVAGFAGDGGPARLARFDTPAGAAPTRDGGYLIADTNNHRIRMISRNGIITTVAGSGPPGVANGAFGGDAGPATAARLSLPSAVTLESSSDAFLIADSGNNRIRRVDANGTITTVAGDGTPGQLSFPSMAIQSSPGNYLIADTGNHRIRSVISGSLGTFAGAGTAGFSGDNGDATSAQFNFPAALAFEASGNALLVADGGNHRIRRIDSTTLQITTVAGSAAQGYDGDGAAATAAKLDTPVSVAPTTGSDFLFTDFGNHAIRSVAGGTISTLTGNGLPGFAGDGQGAAFGRLNSPVEVARFAHQQNSAATLLVADSGNHRVRAIGTDNDGDGHVDQYDNCEGTANLDQADFDLDGDGDACDADRDGDGAFDFASFVDNCPGLANPGQADADGDRIGDACDPTPLPSAPPATATATSAPAPGPAPGPAPVGERSSSAVLRFASGVVTLSRSRVATLGTVACPAAATCRITAPRTLRVRIRRRSFTFTLSGAGAIAAGRSGTLSVLLPAAAATRLGTRTVSFSFRLRSVVNGVTSDVTMRSTIKGRPAGRR